MARAYSVKEVINMKKKTIILSGGFAEAFGSPEAVGVWFVWGNSGNGKSSFIMQLAKELAMQYRVVINALEEGTAKTMQDSLLRHDMLEVNGKLTVVEGESMQELSERLLKRRSPEVAIIDSFQYAQMTYRQYIAYKEKHRNKLLIFVSHADGKQPTGRSARSVMYDSTLKIWVEGYVAFSKGRFYGKTGKYTIWDKGAYEYWNKEGAKYED